MVASDKPADIIVSERGLSQVSDSAVIASLVKQVLAQHPEQVASYLQGKEAIANWLFGQVMRAAKGQANPQIVRAELEKQLTGLRNR
jgi:aspartyl-tRNA(Asn)/glutamyl-tRNA(Gln) amidotransferase subunit B